LSMNKDANLKKVVRRHATETGHRYAELTDLEGLGPRMDHEPPGLTRGSTVPWT
jgi:hypothetical protein